MVSNTTKATRPQSGTRAPQKLGRENSYPSAKGRFGESFTIISAMSTPMNNWEV